MKKVLVLETDYETYWDNDYQGSISKITNTSDWAEISEKEFEELKEVCASTNRKRYKTKYVLVEKVDKLDISKIVEEYKEHKKDLEEKQRKRDENEAKRIAKQELNKIKKKIKENDPVELTNKLKELEDKLATLK